MDLQKCHEFSKGIQKISSHNVWIYCESISVQPCCCDSYEKAVSWFIYPCFENLVDSGHSYPESLADKSFDNTGRKLNYLGI